VRAQNEDKMPVNALFQKLKSFNLALFFRDDCGASAIEYGLIVAAIAIAIIAAVFSVGSDLSNLFDAIASDISSSADAAN
jgi:pilus assembly protein Flp/PilA